MRFCPASSAFPGSRHWEAVELAKKVPDPYLGSFDMAHMQLCPQHPSKVSEELIDRCQDISPNTTFRLHASVRVSGAGDHQIWDASNARDPAALDYWNRVGQLSRHSGAAVYSLHAGRTQNADLKAVRDNVLWLQDLMGFEVALEGLYPEKEGAWLLSSWDDYEWLLNRSDLFFAIDLSHLNILARSTGEINDELVRAMLSSEKCLEIHISGNNGVRDSHEVLRKGEWWFELLNDANRNAVVFNESTILSPNQLVKMKLLERNNEQRSSKSGIY